MLHINKQKYHWLYKFLYLWYITTKKEPSYKRNFRITSLWFWLIAFHKINCGKIFFHSPLGMIFSTIVLLVLMAYLQIPLDSWSSFRPKNQFVKSSYLSITVLNQVNICPSFHTWKLEALLLQRYSRVHIIISNGLHVALNNIDNNWCTEIRVAEVSTSRRKAFACNRCNHDHLHLTPAKW